MLLKDMIDDLIEDTESEMPRYFKDQKDGKRVDHIYRYKSLIVDDNIYFVGDSKYYKPDRDVIGESVAKQYTYAKNIIQYNIDIINDKSKCSKDATIRYRDPLTEGYNITPNFFISAFVEEPFSFNNDGLKVDGDAVIQYHYPDRLFDRDTLLVQKYNINFLYVLSTYISKGTLDKEAFKDKAQAQFRERMIKCFSEKYKFYKVTPNKDLGVDGFVQKYFRELNGKMYRPSGEDDTIIVAYEIKHKNEALGLIYAADCDIQNYNLY